MKIKQRKTRHTLAAFFADTAAFTRLELFVCVVCVALLAAFALPVLATSRSRSDVVQCLNNLRQSGIAVHAWGTDHQFDPPWRTYVSDGGTLQNPGIKPATAWLEFAFLSNQLVTPRILACPADTGAKVASDFSSNPSQGYTAVSFRSQSTSYFINLHTLSSQPNTVVFGDRNVRFVFGSSCPYAVNAVSLFPPVGSANVWSNAVHGLQGNVVLMDGSVMVTTSEQARTALEKSSINGSLHFMPAR